MYECAPKKGMKSSHKKTMEGRAENPETDRVAGEVTESTMM